MRQCDRGPYPDHFRRFGDLTLFRAHTHGQGYELWRTEAGQASGNSTQDVRGAHP
ncbi:MAG TPA: hypothetical protein VJV23_02495 [Candidatus Polarisedimenticolia bacterium]|nr:hypothetical protein [Candidatus Polarisedimenticolia bacterium]